MDYSFFIKNETIFIIFINLNNINQTKFKMMIIYNIYFIF